MFFADDQELPMATTDLVIETHGLSKTYKDTAALKSLNLQVHPNSIFGFLGPNGAGKTTTIKLLLGLAQPTGGGATVFGHDIMHASVEIRKRVGYLAQDPRYYEYMTARQTLHYTAPNTTNQPRLAYPMEFQITPVRRKTPVDMPWMEQFRKATGGPHKLIANKKERLFI